MQLPGDTTAPFQFRDLTLYVSATSGNDTSGDGSYTNPYATIAKATAVRATDGRYGTIQMAAGTFTEEVVPANHRVTYKFDSGAVIDGGGVRQAINADNVDGIVIDGLTATNCVDTVQFTTCLSCTVKNFAIHDEASAGSGIQFDTNSTGGTVSNGVVYNVNTGVNFATGCDNPTVEDVEIYNFDARGVYFYSLDTPTAQRLTIHDETGAGIGYGIEAESCTGTVTFTDICTDTMSHGLIAKVCTAPQITNCSASNCDVFGFYAKGAPGGLLDHFVADGNAKGVALDDNAGVPPASTGWTIRNGVLLNNSTGIYTRSGSNGSLTTDYNDYYGNTLVADIEATTYTTVALYQSGESQEAHGQTVDPNYADESCGGFALPSGSGLLTAASDGGPIGLE